MNDYESMSDSSKCIIRRERTQLLAFLSVEPERWSRYVRQRLRQDGKGALVLRGSCSGCGKSKVAYIALHNNAWLNEAVAGYSPSDEFVIGTERPSDGLLLFFRFSFRELRFASLQTLN